MLISIIILGVCLVIADILVLKAKESNWSNRIHSLFLLLTASFALILGATISIYVIEKETPSIKEKAVKEYLQHPENYSINYRTTITNSDSTTIHYDTTIIYKKK